MTTFLRFLLAASVSLPAFGFGLFNNLVNNISSGGYLCGRVSGEQVERFSHRYGLSPIAMRSTDQRSALEQFEAILFENSRKLFRDKTRCMSDYAAAVTDSADAIDEIRQTMALVWLNKKKASLILRECDVIMNEIALLGLQRVGSVSGYSPDTYGVENLARRNPRIKKEYFSVCMNNQQVSGLRSLVLLADRSLPVFSSRELMKLMEHHRQSLVSKRTLRPVTDGEILTMDLESEQALVRFDPRGRERLEGEVRAYLRAKATQRQALSESLRTKSFSRQLLQELYDDGSVDELLLRSGIGATALAQDPELNRMVSCVRADYDTSLLGTSLDFIAVFALSRAGLSKVSALRGAPAFLKDALAASVAGAPAIIKSCLASNRITEHFSGLSRNHTVGVHKSHLPPGLDVDIYSLESVPLESVPACSRMQYDHIFLDQSLATSCVEEAVYNILPLGMGLSFTMGQMILED